MAANKAYRVLYPVRYEGKLRTSGTIMLTEKEAESAVSRGILEPILGASSEASGKLDEKPDDLDAEMIRLFGEDLAKDLYAGGYKSVEGVRGASEEELLAVNGVGKKRYEQIRRASDSKNVVSGE